MTPGRALRAEGLVSTCWGEPLTDPFVVADVVGRLYVRATRAGLLLDATFEGAPVDVHRAFGDATVVEGIPVCPEWAIWAARLRKDEAAPHRFAATHGLVVRSDRRA